MNAYRLFLISAVAAVPMAQAADDLLPPNAKPGECYARVLVPPTYEKSEKQLVKKEGTEIIEVVPAKYEWAEEQVLIKEESEKLKVIPAKYKTVEETVMVKPASKKIVTVPAKYRTEKEKILVKPGYTTWKRGRGLIEKVDNSTGEIMCLVEVPPEYKTVTKEVLAEPPKTEVVEVPAEYKTVKKRVIAEPARVEKVKVPAEYATVKVRKLVEDAKENRTTIAPEYVTVAEVTKTKDAFLEWRSVLCETNTTPGVIRKLQQALTAAGHYNGAIDGVIGAGTRAALTRYQEAKGLAKGQLTTETLESLGISI